jgi:diguanylate cyclase (GGDEF)-like protein
MLLNKLLKRYKQLPIITKLIIPQIVIFVIGIIYISYAYNHISKITNNYNIIKNSIIPSLEKSNTNIILLKQISNDFTFAILASEDDFLDSPKQHNQKIIQNLQAIQKLTKLNLSKYIKNYKHYFDYTLSITQKLINSDTQTQHQEEINSVLTLYKQTYADFKALNQKLKNSITNQTSSVSNELESFHIDIIIFGIIIYIIFFGITWLVYNGLQKNFLALIKDISNIRQSMQIKDKLAQFSKNEFGMLTNELNELFSNLSQVYQNLENQANKDKLTQLYNRTYIDNKIKSLTQQNSRFGIILIDIDHFKNINDTYGHIAGDEILKSCAKIIQESVDSTDIVCRWGGEEFMVLSTQQNDISSIVSLANKIRIHIQDYEFAYVSHLTASFGCNVYDGSDKFSHTLHQTDLALYLAKKSGRNCVKSAENIKYQS